MRSADEPRSAETMISSSIKASLTPFLPSSVLQMGWICGGGQLRVLIGYGVCDGVVLRTYTRTRTHIHT